MAPRMSPQYDPSMSKKAMVRLFAGLITLTLGTSVATVSEAAPKPPKPQPQYVALGDSYAAGDGAGTYLSDGTDCHRSLLGYPGLVAANGNLALNLQACSGADIGDVTSLQLGALSGSTAYVTITIGGNDIGFSSVVSTCLGNDTNACLTAVTTAEDLAANQLTGQLTTLFSAVKAKVGTGTKIVATSYPRLFNGSDCSVWTDFTVEEMTRLNEGADTLAGVIQVAASTAGIGYTDVRTPFVGHAVCDATPWIHNVSLFVPQYEYFHPTADGYRYGYTPGVATSLGVSATKPGKGKPTVTTGGQTSTDTSRGDVQVNPAKD